MAHAQLQQELEESKAEIQRLRERMSLGTPTVHKDLSLISLIPKWSGSCAFLIGSFSKKMAKWKRFCHACNLLCIIDEVFLFTQVTIIKKVATCLCFTLKIQSGRILNQITQDSYSLCKARDAWTTDCVTAGHLTLFRFSIRPIDGFSEKLIHVATIQLITYLSLN